MNSKILEENIDKSIKPCDSLLEVYRELKDNYFGNFYNVIPICMALGWKKNKKIEPKSMRSDGVKISIIYQNVPYFKYLIYGLAMNDMKDISGLSNDPKDQDERIRIAQLYLNGGLSYIQSIMNAEINIDVNSIRDFLIRELMSSEGKKGIFDELRSL